MTTKPPKPPAHLAATGKRIWTSVQAEFTVDDAAGLALLRAACEAADRADQARRRIAREGAVVKDRFGQLKAHPSVAIERDARAAMIAAFRALHLSPEIL